MAIDTRIPMMGQQLDTASPLAALSNGIAEKQRYDQKLAIEASDKQYDRARQAKMDKVAIGAAGQESQLRALQIVKAKYDNANDHEKKQVQDAAIGATHLEALKGHDDLIQKYLQEHSNMFGESAKDLQEAYASDQTPDKQAFHSLVNSYKQVGFITGAIKDPKPEMTTNMQDYTASKNDPGYAAFLQDKKEKPLPASAASGIIENRDNLRKAQVALDLISGKDIATRSGATLKGDKDATGYKGMLSDAVLQRTDPQGVDARAAISDLGSMIIHDRSGAAVSASEYPRLQPFIPKNNDHPDVVKKKLERFINEFQAINDESVNFYNESGYKVPDMHDKAVQAPANIDPTVWSHMTPEEQALFK
jgi:hypothetical protein